MIPEIGRGMGPASVVSMSSPFSSSSSASDSLQSVGRATEAAAEFSGQNNARAGLGQVRIVDLRETMKRLPEAGKGVFGWYASRYLNGPSKRTAPLIHLALVCGILGYSFEYSHLSKCENV
jgi:hypothetical protein